MKQSLIAKYVRGQLHLLISHSTCPHYNRRSHEAHTGAPVEYIALMAREECTVGPHSISNIGPFFQDQEILTNYLVHRNKNRKLSKMRQQKNILQTKEKDKNKEELGKMEIKIPPNKEFKIMIIKMLNEKTG